VTGARARPRVQSTLRADSLRWHNGKVHDLAGQADVELAPGGAIALDLNAQHVLLGDRQFDHARLAAQGTRESHTLELAMSSEHDSLQLGARGGLRGRAWNGALQRLDLASRDFGAWSLEREARLTADPGAASLDDFCWRSGESRFCAQAVWRREAWTLDARIENARLALLEPVLPAALDLTGPLSGTLSAQGGEGRAVRGELDVALGPGELVYPVAQGRTGRATLHPSRLSVRTDGVTRNTSLLLALNAGDTVQAATHSVPGPDGGARVVSGDLHARISDLGFVQAFVPDLANTRGVMTADLSLSGTTATPRWSGSARLTGGAADVPRLGLSVVDIGLEARNDAQGHLTVQGGARSGPGRVDLTGRASATAGGFQTAEATLKGDRLLAMDTKDSRVLVSPNLVARLHGDSIEVTGEVVVPEADIRPRPPAAKAVRPSPDVVYVDTLTAERAPRRTFRTVSEVRLTLGRNVRVRAYGLDARLTGSILAIDRPDMPATGSGELTVSQGTYSAYGRPLDIERGRLVFSGGPITNPGLDGRASRRSNDGVVAGFELHGTLNAPRLTVFSEPEMAERDALAYVLFGRRIDYGSQSQQALVTDAANVLSLTGGSYVASTLAGQLGIDEAAVVSEGAFEDASLILGTYLSPRLYVNYGVGIRDPSSTLRIQYYLTRKWTLQAETGSESRAGILYTVER
jgi:translocation and assembly module TamB